mgnify:CR=1 FL=1
MFAHLLSVLGYVVCTFAVQGTSHVVVNKAHYAAIPLLRAEPIVAMGISSMVIQGAVLTFLYSRSDLAERGLIGALVAAWAVGLVIVSYIALAEYGKYNLAGFASWATVEVTVGVIQFTLIGIALWLAHRFAGAAQAA